MEKAIEAFTQYQKEAEERFERREEEHWKRDTELEEKRRQEDREHEMRMMQMLGQMFQGGTYHNYTYVHNHSITMKIPITKHSNNDSAAAVMNAVITGFLYYYNRLKYDMKALTELSAG